MLGIDFWAPLKVYKSELEFRTLEPIPGIMEINHIPFLFGLVFCLFVLSECSTTARSLTVLLCKITFPYYFRAESSQKDWADWDFTEI